MGRTLKLGAAADEFEGADLGDHRRGERLKIIAGLLEREPAKGFPRSMGSDAALEGFYRFINNEGFSADDILAPHRSATLKRARSAGPVVAIHDTTHVQFSTQREGLGATTGKRQFGFVAHVGLLVTEAEGLPLGVAHLETLTRTGHKWRKRKREGQRTSVALDDAGRESLRWLRSVDALAAEEGLDVLHVTDAEGDFYELFEHLTAKRLKFVIRAGQLDRSVITGGETCSLRDTVRKIRPKLTRTIELSERRHPPRAPRSRRKRHPDRAGRRAKIAIGATEVILPRTRYSQQAKQLLPLRVVRVWEPKPPESEPGVEWVLLTTEDTTTPEGLGRIVDLYRKRWMIEEYFKALKSGCSLEKRQVESYDALCKVLALFCPIAYRLLLLRALQRDQPTMPARFAFSRVDLELMQRAPSNQRLGPPKTVDDAFTHLARLGGHLRSNGPPGWQILSWGYEKLLTMRLGYELAMAERCDQS